MGQDVELWQAYQAPGGDEAGPAQDGKLIEDLGEDAQVRYWSTDRLRSLIRNLEPYVNGTFGTVSTKHAQVYMSAVRELNRLWSASFTPPPPPPVEPTESEVEQARIEEARKVREQVLEQLAELRSRTR